MATDRGRIEADLSLLLKRFDRIGFGRNGVLDAEEQIAGWYEALPETDRAEARQIVSGWLDEAPSEAEAAKLHYTTGEKIRALALTLCGRLPIPESTDRLALAIRTGLFRESELCSERLTDALDSLLGPR